MRVSVATAVLCLSLVGICAAQHAGAAMIRKPTHIPAQPLSAALETFAKQRDLQVIYRSDLVDNLRSPGAVGVFTPEEALAKLLAGTGVTYRYLNDTTVTLTPVSAGSAVVSSSSAASVGQGQHGGQSFWDKFLLAQATPRPTPGPASLNPNASQGASEPALQEVIVTAQKREERLQNVPISISVLGGPELDRSTVEGVSEALNVVPGVATSQNYLGGGTSVVIRGVSAAFPLLAGSSPVAYYIDSVPFGLIKSAITPDSSAYDLERIEVLRGPQGTLYGADALNGVVRVLTQDADPTAFDFKARALDSYTQYGDNNYRGDLAVNVPVIQDKLAFRVVLGYEDYDGWIDQPDKHDVNNTELATYRLKVNATPIDNLTIGLSAWSSHDRGDAPSIGYTFDKNASLLDQPISTDYDAYGLKVAYQFSAFTLSSATSYLDYTNTGTLGLDVTPFDTPGSTFLSQTNSNIFSEEVNLNSTQAGNWRWSLGGMYRRGTEDLVQIFTVLPVPTIHYDDTSESYAVYGELTRLLLDGRLELTAGLRHFHDDISQEDQNAPGTPFIPAESTAEANTPRGIVTWHITDHQMAYASYSEGFRSGFPQSAVIPPEFPAAEPDRLRNYELGSKGTVFNGFLVYDASVYYMDWERIQQQIGLPLFVSHTYYLVVVNGQSASGVGTDLALSAQPITGLTLKGSVSWNDLEMDSEVMSDGVILFHKGDRPIASPETTAAASADYLFPVGSRGFNGRLSMSANYTSSQAYRSISGASLVIQDGDPMVFSRLGLSLESPSHWTVTLYGDNLNNERGSPVRAFIGAPNWDAQVRPRTIGLQVDYHLK